jgi:hypothetical protein
MQYRKGALGRLFFLSMKNKERHRQRNEQTSAVNTFPDR